MMLFWNIRYLDRSDRKFRNRCLYLDTQTLDPVTRAAVELVAENRTFATQREILGFKHLFVEAAVDSLGDPIGWDGFMSVGPSGYLEDEGGNEITESEVARILTGNPAARIVSRGAKQHDIDLMLAATKPIPLAEVSLTSEDVRKLGYFVRDLREMRDSAFMREGPGRITSTGSPMLSPTGNPTLETAVTDDEIRSFVIIFRRLCMGGSYDPARFTEVVTIMAKALGDHPYGKWIEGAASEYQRHLTSVPSVPPFVPVGTCTFTTKRLMKVFLYTQYAHQPDAKEQRRFRKCLAELHGKIAILTWLFLTEMQNLSLEVANAGGIIEWWFNLYCDHHNMEPDVLASLRDHHAGLGTIEKEEVRRARLLQESVRQLSIVMWEQAGQPAGGSAQFLATAHDELNRKLSEKDTAG